MITLTRVGSTRTSEVRLTVIGAALALARSGTRHAPTNRRSWTLQSEARRCCSWPITPTACGDWWLEEEACAWWLEEEACAWWLEEEACA
jgi:hypothetical protein